VHLGFPHVLIASSREPFSLLTFSYSLSLAVAGRASSHGDDVLAVSFRRASSLGQFHETTVAHALRPGKEREISNDHISLSFASSLLVSGHGDVPGGAIGAEDLPAVPAMVLAIEGAEVVGAGAASGHVAVVGPLPAGLLGQLHLRARKETGKKVWR